MTKNYLFDVLRDGFQYLTIPRSGRYRFEVIGASCSYYSPGARIIGELGLEKGEKITVALGQRGSNWTSGNGGTFVVKENGTSDPQVLFVSGGAGFAYVNEDFNTASLSQIASGNDKIGTSGVQKLYADDDHHIFCGGAGFLDGPVTDELRIDSIAPKIYKEGLVGGFGIDDDGDVTEGGFGGGGAYYLEKFNGHEYYGAGGGYTGGGTEIYPDAPEDAPADASAYGKCDGGGGGSFSFDKEAKFDHVHEEYGKCIVTYLD